MGNPELISANTKKLISIPRDALVSTFLVANAFVWYLTGFSYLKDTAVLRFGDETTLPIVAVNFLSLVLTALVASSLTSYFKNRLTFLKYWILAGALLSLVFLFIGLSDFFALMVIASVLGVYFGLGMPACMGYYAKTTVPQNRAKLSGLIFLLIGICVSLISTVGNNGAIVATALAGWRFLGFLIVIPAKPKENVEPKDTVTFRSVVSNRTFLLYAAPWFMFSLINDLTFQHNNNYFSSTAIFPAEFTYSFRLIEIIIAGVSAIICGILADKKGRRRLALVGFVLLGLGYASLGLLPGNYYSALFYICVDGVAWGAFSMLFLVTIWGDIAQERRSEKFYFLGVLPYLFSNLSQVLVGNYVSETIDVGTVFSFASIFLFIAILPLVYAPETLSDKLIKNFDISSYVNKALEKAKKEGTKSRKGKEKPTSQPERQEKNDESPDEPAEYEEAKKLAEKYY